MKTSWHPDRATGWRLLLVNIIMAPLGIASVAAVLLLALWMFHR